MCTTFIDMDAWWMSQDFTQTQKQFLENNFYEQKMVNDLWKGAIEPSLKSMTAQLIGTRVHMTGAIGGFIDGQSIAEAQLTMKRLEAEALRDYTPGENVCRLGTIVRSVAGSEVKKEAALLALNEMAEDRLMNTRGGTTERGPNADASARFNQFTRIYCNPGDNNGFMKQLCHPKSASPGSKAERLNKDIDIVRTLNTPMTLDLNFTDSSLTPDEEDVLALSSNLYANDIFNDLPSAVFSDSPGDPNKPTYLDLRQVAALRSVAQHSFNVLAAERARGTEGATVFLRNVLEELGMTKDEAKRYLDAEKGEPSYNAQMEILTKKIYQNPNFYVNLVDKPTNVKRQIAAMSAIELSQNRDLFESIQRQEMLLSLLLELEIRQEQQVVINDKNSGSVR